ncbi:DNA-binding protein [Natronomonas sp. EA1]|uniref:DNA-binding protein n=1 Tax=Natronomonas sp. EA1 TaxID=3421655 RepID=UPI003EBC94A4
MELRSQAKIDSEAIAKVDGTGEHPYGMTLEAQEKWEAREAEKARTRERRKTQSSVREWGSRVSVARGRKQARRAFEERAASVDSWQAPGRGDPREMLERDELAAINQQARHIASKVRDSSSPAAVSRRLAERVADGDSLLSASVAVMEAEQRRWGSIVPIGLLEELSRREVSIQGEVTRLFEASSPAIQQVGLIEDETGTTKFTVWRASRCTVVEAGDEVRMRDVAKNWYGGRVSVALTGESRIVFPERA